MSDGVLRRVEEVPPRLLLPHGSASPDRLHVVEAMPLPETVPEEFRSRVEEIDPGDYMPAARVREIHKECLAELEQRWGPDYWVFRG